MKTKLATALLIAMALTGCMRIGESPVIEGAYALNEFGLYTVSLHVNLAGIVRDPLLVWDFGDGAKGAGADPVHDYGRTGTFIVTVTATNPHGGSSALRFEVIVQENVVCCYEDSRPGFVVKACDYPHTREDFMLGVD